MWVKCEICGKGFDNYPALISHLYQHIYDAHNCIKGLKQEIAKLTALPGNEMDYKKAYLRLRKFIYDVIEIEPENDALRFLINIIEEEECAEE